MKAIRMLATNCAIAARIDAFQKHPMGEEGVRIREKIFTRLNKVMAP